MPNFSGESHLVTSDPSRAHLQFEPQAQLQSTANGPPNAYGAHPFSLICLDLCNFKKDRVRFMSSRVAVINFPGKYTPLD